MHRAETSQESSWNSTPAEGGRLKERDERAEDDGEEKKERGWFNNQPAILSTAVLPTISSPPLSSCERMVGVFLIKAQINQLFFTLNCWVIQEVRVMLPGRLTVSGDALSVPGHSGPIMRKRSLNVGVLQLHSAKLLLTDDEEFNRRATCWEMGNILEFFC